MQLKQMLVISKFNRTSVAISTMNAEFSTLTSYLELSCVNATNKSTSSSSSPKLLDFDANLFHKDVNFASAIQRAQDNGVEHFVVPGSTLTDSEQAIAAAEKHTCVVAASAGIHPYNTESTILNSENVQALRTLITSPYCMAVGECGFDFSDGFPASSYQIDWFR